MGFVDSCTTYIGAYQSEFSLDETKILFILSYLRNEAGTSCAASRWVMNWKQRNFERLNGIKAGVTLATFLEELQRAFGDSNTEQLSDFEMLAADAQYNVVTFTDSKGEYMKGDQDNILIEFLERGLSSEIASRLYNTGVPLPKAYGAFKDWKKRTFFNRATMLVEIENRDKDNEFLKEIVEKLREKGF
ncbi:unnamed protein product [Mycena citricolor]|uniref:Uncharacterized protein n=1 Tax=Mycena citricolor TaxID=2018698 RepID=A0AAD2H039_9AGAR|nr:unnamed protein product [Mycena citricolor]